MDAQVILDFRVGACDPRVGQDRIFDKFIYLERSLSVDTKSWRNHPNKREAGEVDIANTILRNGAHKKRQI